MTVTFSGSSTPGRYSSLTPVRCISAAWSAVRQPRSTSRPARASIVATAVPHEPAPTPAGGAGGGERRAPPPPRGPGAGGGGAGGGGRAGEPLPLEHHAGPDAVGD